MTKLGKIIVSLIAGGISVVAVVVLVAVVGNSTQEDICERSLEQSFAVLLERESRTSSSSGSSPTETKWTAVGAEVRDRLLRYAHNNNYNECRDFYHLVEGKDARGKPLSIETRLSQLDRRIEVRLLPSQ
jgi:ABC-type lipoprotein release transport system permease subunit